MSLVSTCTYGILLHSLLLNLVTYSVSHEIQTMGLPMSNTPVVMLLFIAMGYWGYMSFEVKGRWGLLLPPCPLITVVWQTGTSSPPSQLKHSSPGVIWMCRASFTNSSYPLPWSSTEVSSQWIGNIQETQTAAMFCLMHPFNYRSRFQFQGQNLAMQWRLERMHQRPFCLAHYICTDGSSTGLLPPCLQTDGGDRNTQ